MIVISIISLSISALTLLHSIFIGFYNKKMKETILEKDLLNSIKNSHSSWHFVLQKKIELQKMDETGKKILNGIEKERVEEYLNSMDYACDKYNESLINAKSFNRNFYKLIEEASDDEILAQIVNSNKKNKFKALKKAFNQIRYKNEEIRNN